MRVLVADDDPISRTLVENMLDSWGYEVETAEDGTDAWNCLDGERPPSLVVLDWIMPGLYGDEICRRARLKPELQSLYIIMVTQKTGKQDIVHGLSAGANDYITKPFNHDELKARMEVGERVVRLQEALALQVRELEKAISKIKKLEGIIPICSYCKKIRSDETYWEQVENYIAEHSSATFSHGVCPECFESIVKPALDDMDKDGNINSDIEAFREKKPAEE